MAAIKPINDSAEKWTRRASVAGPDYQRGVENPRKSWEEASIAAEPAYRSAVIQAANAGRYGGGVKRVGDAKWKKNAAAKGPNRFAEGVTLAIDEWRRGYQPYQEAISALDLPARQARGSEANLQRVALVARATRAVRERLGSGR